MSYYIGLPLLVLVALVEVSVLPMFRVQGMQPNLMLVLLVAWLMVRGASEVFVLAPIGGLLLGLVDAAPVGAALIALAPLALIHELRGSQLREGGFIASVAFLVVMSLHYNYVHLAVHTLQGQAGDWVVATLTIILPTALLNVLLLLPFYPTMMQASAGQRRAAYV